MWSAHCLISVVNVVEVSFAVELLKNGEPGDTKPARIQGNESSDQIFVDLSTFLSHG
jgi:hypothetical protein